VALWKSGNGGFIRVVFGCVKYEAENSQKPIDILVNAAGVTHSSPFFATTEELIGKIVQTNLVGTMLGCKTIGKLMLGNKDSKDRGMSSLPSSLL